MFLLTSAKCLLLLNGKVTVGGGGGVDEMDIMNKSELIYDNSCFLSFVCLTYITLQSRGKLSPKFDLLYMCYIVKGDLATYFDEITVSELSKFNET